jgi:isopentenyl-diphosphate delta-isomerase
LLIYLRKCIGKNDEEQVEHIVIVDTEDNFLGVEEKEKCHDGDGILHRGFLAMVLSDSGELLLTRRSDRKRLWPGFWDGTVASHVIEGEDYIQASRRRLSQEIGLTAGNIQYAFKFHYHIKYRNIGSENEICAVTLAGGFDAGSISVNDDEISAVKTITLESLMKDIRENKQLYTPWLIIAMEHIELTKMKLTDFLVSDGKTAFASGTQLIS